MKDKFFIFLKWFLKLRWKHARLEVTLEGDPGVFLCLLSSYLFLILLYMPTPTPRTLNLPCTEPKSISFHGGTMSCLFVPEVWHAVALNHLPVPGLRLLLFGQPWHSFCWLLCVWISLSLHSPFACNSCPFLLAWLSIYNFHGHIAPFYLAFLDVKSGREAFPPNLNLLCCWNSFILQFT